MYAVAYVMDIIIKAYNNLIFEQLIASLSNKDRPMPK